MASTHLRRAAVALALALIATASCTVKNTEPPPLSGPSGLALTLTLNAIPDSISQDGGSQSSVKVTATGPDGRPVSALPLRVDMMVNGVAQDYGTLSARSLVTNGDGVASVVYTAPPSPSNGLFGTCNSLPGNCVSIVATATATNFSTANPESVLIRLVPLGVILPTAGVPTAAFSFSPIALSAGLSTQFDASTSLPGLGATEISTYSWNFGDGTSGSGRNVTHTFGAGNSFVVTLTVTNDRGLAASVSKTLSVNPAALPTPTFTVSPQAPAVNQVAFFNGQASTAGQGHTIESYRWNFGDGTSGSGSTISHAFTAAGTYTVQLTVTDDVGTSVTSTGTTVTVGAAPTPTASFTFSPSAPAPNQAVLFNASSSTAGAGHTLSSYAWDFGDHGTGTLVSPSHKYTTTGTFTVTLTVTDEIGQSSVTSKTVTVANAAAALPTAAFTFSPSAPAPNQTVLFNASSSTAGTGHTLSSYAWDFGDNSTGTAVTTSHAYTAAGAFTVTLKVTDEAGQINVTSKTVTIANAAATLPTATFTFSPAKPGVNETVFFNASTSVPGAGHTIASYAWTFGDNGTATGVTASHAYTTAGNYSVQLKVTDEAGQSTTSAATPIDVGSPPSPTANFTSSPEAPVTNQAVVFDASSSTTAQGQTITKLAWNFGDGTDVVTCESTGTSASADCTPNTGGRIASHKFTTAGKFTVNLVVTDSAGRIGSKSAQVTVATGNPTAALSLVKKIGNEISADGTASTAVGSSQIATYTFAWGDSTANTSGSAAVVSHTFTVAGTYVVTLTVTDNFSPARSNATTQSVTVP